MDDKTVAYYNQHAAELTARYERADLAVLHHLLLRHLPPGGRVLEIGCGSGRDAAFMLANGHAVETIDASAAMVDAAAAAHPELRGHVQCAAFPLADAGLAARSGSFDAVVSIATWMHLPDPVLFDAVRQMQELLREGGVAIINTSRGRSGLTDDRDVNGRLFVERPAQEYRLLFERVGFRLTFEDETDADGLGRDLSWITLVFQRARERPSVDQIETIIHRDRKTATYKLALLRAVCEIAQTEHFRATWEVDGSVSVPLGLVAEKWLTYYWPLVEADVHVADDPTLRAALGVPAGAVLFPQNRGRERNRPMAFRAALGELVRRYPDGAGLARLLHEYRGGRVPLELQRSVDHAIRTIARTIVVGPVKYAGGALQSDTPFFAHSGYTRGAGNCSSSTGAERALGQITVPGDVWREMVLIGHWVGESLILRWAELMRTFIREPLSADTERQFTAAALQRLWRHPTSERDTDLARSIYRRLPELLCVWTGQPLRTPSALHVDHVIPFSLWFNNDLWNLLPAAQRINSAKSDKLVARATLAKRKDLIIHYWEAARREQGERFDTEARRSLIRGSAADAAGWQNAAFAGLVENIETIAMQRGIERWSA